MRQYPEETIATIEDFKSSRWKAAIDSTKSNGYSAIWQALSQVANSAFDEGKFAESKVLWLLADSCSMMLKPKSINDPFKPIFVIDGKRSALPEDFNESDIVLLSEIAEILDNELVRARVCDLVWLCKKPRSVDHALMAINAYQTITLDSETWSNHALDCWQRAITLSKQLRAGAGESLDKIESELVKKFNLEPINKEFYRLSISRLLFENKLGHEHARHIADTLAKHGTNLFEGKAYYQARSYLEAAAQWYSRLGEAPLLADITCAIAETWVNEAVDRINSDQPSHIVAASFYENAIQAYRSVPREFRAERKIDERISELHKSLDVSGKASLNEMGVVSSGDIDISELVEATQASVRGKPLLEALAALANVHHGARKKKIAEFSEKMLQENPLQALMSATHISRDGRVVAKRPGMGSGNQDSDDYRITLRAEMVKHYSMEVGLIVQAQIWPALQAFLLDHRIQEHELVQIISQSPIVPTGRVTLISKAIFAGFERDFVSALHLLVPQMEHLVRSHLKSAGVKTTTLNTEGIENENGLSTLVDLPEMEKIFGENLAFEINSLFCDAFGPNLRNEIAHGLLDEDSCQSTYAVYAWWFLLHLTFNTFWNAARKANDK